jgi:acyl dehydratase
MNPEPIVFERLPSLLAWYGRAVLRLRRPGLSPELPRLSAVVRDVTTNEDRLADYRAVCGFPDGAFLPPTWPQVLAAPLHAALLAHERFPFAALGLVHTASRITQHRPMAREAALTLAVHVEGLRPARQGFEFDLVTHADVDGERAWESVTTILARTLPKAPKEERRRDSAPPGEGPRALRSVVWRAPPDQGRRYAAVSGDFNPIHLSRPTAMLFGFPRAVVHGMWLLARTVAELDVPDTGPLAIEAQFRRPVLLPSELLVQAYAREGGLDFAVRTADAAHVHLVGHCVASSARATGTGS